MNDKKKAVVLLSGGLDSATTLAIARKDFDCYALSFNYGQRHSAELIAAGKVAESMQVQSHRIQDLDLTTVGGSALTDKSIAVPEVHDEGIPITYVPARNTIFLSFALAWAEVLACDDIFIGVNAVDYSGYPDCRPEYIQAFQQMANLATKRGVEGERLIVHTPLINLGKADIIKTGVALGVDYSLTVSCYQADDKGAACGVCDSCRFRREGFAAAGIEDPATYR